MQWISFLLSFLSFFHYLPWHVNLIVRRRVKPLLITNKREEVGGPEKMMKARGVQAEVEESERREARGAERSVLRTTQTPAECGRAVPSLLVALRSYRFYR